jgi:hypothetical protein
MKIGDRRIQDNDFQQVEECYSCKKLFWASSEYELGNWQQECPECRKAREEKYERETDTVENRTIDGKPLTVANIDDYIRARKMEGIKRFYWTPEEWVALGQLMSGNGFSQTFMGTEHSVI